MENNQTRIGIGIMILKDGKVLLTKRKNAHGAGEFAFPGGHLEYMESFEQCALREISEECGLKVKNLNFLFLSNLKKYAPKHYVHIGLIADWESGEPQVLEPDKCESWEWYDMDNLPSPRFETCELSFIAHKTGKNYFDL